MGAKMFVVVIIPRAAAPAGAWLAGAACEGPFDTGQAAVDYAKARERTIGRSWIAQVVKVTEPLHSIVRALSATA